MKKRSSAGLIVLAYIAFISLGLPDGLLGVAWPGIRSRFGLPLDALGLLLVFSTSGYMLSSFISGALARKLGLGGLLSASCALTATALLVYSVTPYWWLFVLSASLGGLGAGAIDAAINTYVAQNHSERMMQWLHASFGIGITLGPFIMTLGISLTTRWQPGYYVVAGAQALLAGIFFLTRGIWKGSEAAGSSEEEHHGPGEASIGETLRQLPVLLSLFMFLIYTGVELGLGLWSYSLLTEPRGIDPAVAGFVTGSYWGMFTLGRFLAGWYTRKVGVRQLIIFSITAALAGTGLVLANLGNAPTVIGIALTGLAIAPIFPGLVSDTVNRVGSRHQANTIGMQIAFAGFGAMIIPSAAGVLARHFGLEVIPLFLTVNLALLLISFLFSHVRAGSRLPEGARRS